MILNGKGLYNAAPIKGMQKSIDKIGYSIHIKQKVHFRPNVFFRLQMDSRVDGVTKRDSRFVLAETVEEFQMPHNLMGVIYGTPKWMCQGLSVFSTIIEPCWSGFLTLELIYHGTEELFIPSGADVARVVFHEVSNHDH